MQGDDGRKEGEGYGDEGDYRGSGVHKEDEQYDNNEEGAFEEGILHIVDTALDEARLAIDIRGKADIGGQGGAQVGKRTVEIGGEGERAGVGLLGDGEGDCRLAVVARHTGARGLVAHLHLCHIAQAYRARCGGGHESVG